MKSKPDFYKQTIEKDEEELAESVLTPEDISENDKKEIETQKEIVPYDLRMNFTDLHKQESIDNFGFRRAILNDLALSPFLNDKATIQEKMNALLRRFQLQSSVLGTSLLLTNILNSMKYQKSEDSSMQGIFSSSLDLDKKFKEYLAGLHRRREDNEFEIGDLVRVDKNLNPKNHPIPMRTRDEKKIVLGLEGGSFTCPSYDYFTQYAKERNAVFPKGLTGIISGFDSTLFRTNKEHSSMNYFVMVKFPYESEGKWSREWHLPIKHSTGNNIDTGAYFSNELDLIVPTKIESKNLHNLIDSVKRKIEQINKEK